MIRKKTPTDYSAYFDIGDDVRFKSLDQPQPGIICINPVRRTMSVGDLKPMWAPKGETYYTDEKTQTATVPWAWRSLPERTYRIVAIDYSGKSPVYILGYWLNDMYETIANVFPTAEFLEKIEPEVVEPEPIYKTFRTKSILIKPAIYDPVTKTVTEI